MGLEGVLAAHTGSERGDLGAWCVKCYCGHDTSVTRFPGDAWDLYRTHVAAVVLAWLETLAQDEAVREAMGRAIEARNDEALIAAPWQPDGSASVPLDWDLDAAAAVIAFLAAAKDAR